MVRIRQVCLGARKCSPAVPSLVEMETSNGKVMGHTISDGGSETMAQT